ncbi:hypothetical protein P7C71_g5365, partial [Lecanoromycetidae sp. Uapishka_2]
MKASILTTALALLATQTYSAPTLSPLNARQFEAQITFIGAGDASFTQSVPTAPGSTFTIDNDLSVSRISSAGGASCTFFGVDGSTTTVVGANTVDVGPPQTQVSGACSAL